MKRVIPTAFFLLSLSLSSGMSFAQQQFGLSGNNFYYPVLPRIAVVDFEFIYDNTDYGRRVSNEFRRVNIDYTAENETKTEQLQEEEMQLVNMKQEPDFKDLAVKFDEKADQIRKEQDQKGALLKDWRILQRQFFIEYLRQSLGELSVQTEFDLIVTNDSVLWYSDAFDISNIVIEFINARIGDGTSLTSYLDPWTFTGINQN